MRVLTVPTETADKIKNESCPHCREVVALAKKLNAPFVLGFRDHSPMEMNCPSFQPIDIEMDFRKGLEFIANASSLFFKEDAPRKD